MVALTVQLEHADRMMVSARVNAAGVSISFADGRSGVIPLADVPEIGSPDEIDAIALPNAYEVVLRTRDGEAIEIPWDFARAYCEEGYRERIEALAGRGRRAVGARIRELRKAAGMTQEQLAKASGLGRVTLVRIERGEQSPRYDTIVALAAAMHRDPRDVMAPAG